MATIQMKCPNCGGTMTLANNQFICPNCRTMMLNIVDAKIDADVTVMSPDEFAQKIEKSKKQFVVNINDDLKVFDVNTMVINKKIQDATQALNAGRFSEVSSLLNGVPNDVLSAERLRFLAQYSAKNEYELSFHDGYIDTNAYGRQDSHFANIMKLADEKTKATYQKLADYCREQYDTKVRIEKEIKEVEELLSVKLYQEAIAYTKEMCRKYPTTALSWAYACEVKCRISSNYNGNIEFSMMEKCPNFSKVNMPRALTEKINNFQSLSRSYSCEYEEHTKKMMVLAGCMWVAILALGLYALMMAFAGNHGGVVLIGALVYLVGLVSFITTIVFTVKSIKAGNEERRARNSYTSQSNLVPERIRKQYQANCSEGKRKFIIFALIIGFIVIAVGIISFIKMIA